jgi:hypothetical protein
MARGTFSSGGATERNPNVQRTTGGFLNTTRVPTTGGVTGGQRFPTRGV